MVISKADNYTTFANHITIGPVNTHLIQQNNGIVERVEHNMPPQKLGSSNPFAAESRGCDLYMYLASVHIQARKRVRLNLGTSFSV